MRIRLRERINDEYLSGPDVVRSLNQRLSTQGVLRVDINDSLRYGLTADSFLALVVVLNHMQQNSDGLPWWHRFWFRRAANRVRSEAMTARYYMLYEVK